ncbi:MAG: beta-galactosidase [Phycisphaerae bacterium]|jgi:hypothetical protein
MKNIFGFLLLLLLCRFSLATQGQVLNVGYTSVEILNYSNLAINFQNRPVAEAFFKIRQNQSDNSKAVHHDCNIPYHTKEIIVDNGINLVVLFKADTVNTEHNSIIFEIRSNSVSIKYDLAFIDNVMSTDIGFVTSDSFCTGSPFRAFLADGKEVTGELQKDPLFKNATIKNIRELVLSKCDTGKLNVICEQLPPFEFIDTRDISNPKRRINSSIAVPDTRGKLVLLYGSCQDANFVTVDLKPVCNMGFRDSLANDGVGGWMDEGAGRDMSQFVSGKNLYSGIVFDVIEPNNNKGMSAIILKGGPNHGQNFPEQFDIPIGRSGSSFYALYTSGWAKSGTDDGKVVAAYIVKYADGQEDEHEIVYGRDITDWQDLSNKPNYIQAWTGRNSVGNIAIGASSFPLKDKVVQSIRLEKRGQSNCMIGLIGLTLSDQPVQVGLTKLPNGPVSMPPLRYKFVGDAERIAAWLDPNELNVSGPVSRQGYDVTFDSDDVLMMGANHSTPRTEIEPNEQQSKNIVDYVKAGGSLYISWPVDETIRDLLQILPVEQAGEAITFVPKDQVLMILPTDYNHPIFSDINWADYLPQPYYYPVKIKLGSEVIARFSNGIPALVYWKVGKGKVLYSAFPLEYGNYIGTTSGRHPWSRCEFFYKVLYWLKGNEDFARYLGKRTICGRLRAELSDIVASCNSELENLRAVETYIGQENIAKKFNSELQDIFSEMDSSDHFLVTLKLDEAIKGYRNAYSRGNTLLTHILDATSGIKSSALKEKKLDLINIKPGPPLLIGSHCSLTSYGSSRSSDSKVREYSIIRSFQRQSELGFNTAVEHAGLVCFTKKDSDPTVVDDNDLNLWIYNDMLRALKQTGWRYFMSIDSSDLLNFGEGNYKFFHKDMPLGEEPYIYSGRKIYPPSIWNRTFLDRRRQVLEKVTLYYKDKAEIIGYDMDNEPSAYLGYSDDIVKHFQEWLKVKFGSIKRFNAALKKNYTDFNVIKPPTLYDVRKEGVTEIAKRPVWYEWWLFQDDVIVNHFREDYETIKRISPDKIVRERFSEVSATGRPYRNDGAGRLPYHRITKYVDMTGMHMWVLYSLDFMRAQANNAQLGLGEYYMTPLDGPYNSRLQLNDGTSGYWAIPVVESENVNCAAAERNFWIALSRGVRSFNIHTLKAGIGVYNMIQPDNLHWNRTLYALKYAGKEFSRIRGEIDGAEVISQVALLEVPESTTQSFGTAIEEDTICTQVEQNYIFDALHDPLDIQSDPIAPDSNYNGYKVVIASQPLFLSNESEAKVMDFVKKGGIFIATGPLGLYTEHGFANQRILKNIFGITEVKRVTFPSDINLKSGLSIKPVSHKSLCWKYNLSKDLKVLAYFSDGTPAVVETEYGKGRMILTAYALSQTENIAEQLHQLVEPFVNFPVKSSPPVNLFLLRKEGVLLVFAVNKQIYPIERQMKLNGTKKIDDIRAGISIVTDSVPLRLGPGECRVFKIYDK